MNLSGIYYYFVALAMMAFVQIASALKLKVDQDSNGRLCIDFRFSDFLSRSRKKCFCSNLQSKQK